MAVENISICLKNALLSLEKLTYVLLLRGLFSGLFGGLRTLISKSRGFRQVAKLSRVKAFSI